MKIKNIIELKSLYKNPDLFELALTHRSWVNENKFQGGQNNERLEFLGDAVLEYVVSSYLYKKLPNKEEGFLTALRANLVNTKNLSEFASRVKIGELIKLSKGEAHGEGNKNPSLLADTTEAIIGSLFLDQGIGSAESFIQDNILSELPQKLNEPLKDPKSSLQEEVQAKGLPTPKYKVTSETGPDHNKKFIVEVSAGKKTLAEGIGKSKSKAEQDAASKALEQLPKNR